MIEALSLGALQASYFGGDRPVPSGAWKWDENSYLQFRPDDELPEALASLVPNRRDGSRPIIVDWDFSICDFRRWLNKISNVQAVRIVDLLREVRVANDGLTNDDLRQSFYDAFWADRWVHLSAFGEIILLPNGFCAPAGGWYSRSSFEMIRDWKASDPDKKYIGYSMSALGDVIMRADPSTPILVEVREMFFAGAIEGEAAAEICRENDWHLPEMLSQFEFKKLPKPASDEDTRTEVVSVANNIVRVCQDNDWRLRPTELFEFGKALCEAWIDEPGYQRVFEAEIPSAWAKGGRPKRSGPQRAPYDDLGKKLAIPPHLIPVEQSQK